MLFCKTVIVRLSNKKIVLQIFFYGESELKAEIIADLIVKIKFNVGISEDFLQSVSTIMIFQHKFGYLTVKE